MKKEKSKNSLLRLGKQLGIGVLIGVPIGFLIGFFGLLDHPLQLPFQTILDIASGVLLFMTLVSLLAQLYYFIKAEKNYKIYKDLADDDERIDELYRVLSLDYSYAVTFTGLMSVLGMVSLMLNLKLDNSSNGLFIFFSIWPFVVLVYTTVMQMLLMKRHNKIKGIKAPLVPTLKEVKDNVLGLDEAELQANYKMSFEIVMNLSSMVLPGIYLFCFALSAIQGEVELTGLLIAGGIHIYIMVMQLKMAKNYYK